MIPVLYKANETDFSHLGLGVLTDTLRAEVTEERNGVFELEVDYPVDGLLFNALKNDRLIRVDASPKLKDQRFRIVHMEKKTNQIMTVFAEHVSYLSQDLALNPTVNYSGNASSALNTWSTNIVDSHPFTTFSDISHSASGRWEIEDVENARRALGGVRGSLLDSYGGEYRFDNYHIQLWQDRGRDSGVLIAYGKNLVDLEQEEEITSTYTSIYPYSIIQDEDGNDVNRITLPELYIDSEHVDKYARRKILVVDFSGDEIATVDALRSRAEQYIEANNIGIPKVNIRVQFQDLAKTVDYADLELVEEINLCDTVDVYYEKLDIQTNAKIIKVVWNVLLDEYAELEIGEARSSLSQTVNNIVDGRVDEVDRRVNRVQIAANGKNRIFRGADEPTQGMSLNDLWYKPVGEGETELYRWNGNIWTLEKVSAGLLGGTLDAENGDVNLINVNVANIVGETSEFVRSWWSGIDESIYIDSGGIHSVSGGNEIVLSDGRIRSNVGSSRLEIDGSVLTLTGNVGTPGSSDKKVTITPGQLIFNHGGTESGLTFDGQNLFFSSSISLPESGRIAFPNVGTIFNSDNGNMTLMASELGKGILTLAVGVTSDFKNQIVIRRSRIDIQTELNMQGNNITNQSDERLKENLVIDEIDSLSAIKGWQMAGFNWRDKEMSQDRQFSVVAQTAPEISAEGADGYLNVNSSLQLSMTTHAVQQLAKKVDELEALINE